MLLFLLSFFPVVAESSGISVPLSLILSVGGGLVGAVCFLFKVIVNSYEKRISEQSASQERRVTEMAESNHAIAEEVAAQWRATDRTNRLNAMRMIASQQVSGDCKEECRAITSEIDSERESATQRLNK